MKRRKTSKKLGRAKKMPRVKPLTVMTEVVVPLQTGDPNRPYILGSNYNG
jgi:ribosomal protein L1